MAKKKRLWPFGATPAGLGLKGKDRERAEAYYTMDGRELMERLAELEHGKDTDSYKKRMLEIRRDYENLSEEEMVKITLELTEDKDSKEYKLALLHYEFSQGSLKQHEYDKGVASANGEPWVGYKEHGLERDTEGKLGFFFDLDWNDEFVKELEGEGYKAPTPEIAVKLWYGELCRTVALEEGLALDFMEKESPEKEEPKPAQVNDRGPEKDGKRVYS